MALVSRPFRAYFRLVRTRQCLGAPASQCDGDGNLPVTDEDDERHALAGLVRTRRSLRCVDTGELVQQPVRRGAEALLMFLPASRVSEGSSITTSAGLRRSRRREEGSRATYGPRPMMTAQIGSSKNMVLVIVWRRREEQFKDGEVGNLERTKRKVAKTCFVRSRGLSIKSRSDRKFSSFDWIFQPTAPNFALLP